MCFWEIASDLDVELKFVLIQLLNEGINPEWCSIITIYAVVHHQKFTIWWIYNECSHSFKVSQIDTFMKVAIIEDHGALDACCGLANLEIIV